MHKRGRGDEYFTFFFLHFFYFWERQKQDFQLYNEVSLTGKKALCQHEVTLIIRQTVSCSLSSGRYLGQQQPEAPSRWEWLGWHCASKPGTTELKYSCTIVLLYNCTVLEYSTVLQKYISASQMYSTGVQYTYTAVLPSFTVVMYLGYNTIEQHRSTALQAYGIILSNNCTVQDYCSTVVLCYCTIPLYTVKKFSCTAVLYQSTTNCTHERLYCMGVQYTCSVLGNSCTFVELYRCTVVQLYSCTVVELYSCTVLQLYSCTVVQLYSCTVVQL